MIKIKEKWNRLSNNTKWLLITEPGWSLPMPWVFYYQPLYMKVLGVSEIGLGLLTSFGMGMSIILPFVGDYFGEKIGKKWAFIILDLICNIGYLLSLFFARDIIAFLLTYLFSALYSAIGPLWETLLVEEIDDESRTITYSTISLINLFGSLSTPIAGIIIQFYGILKGFRYVILIALILFIIKTLVLVFKIKERPVHQYKKDIFRRRLSDVTKIIVSNYSVLLLFTITIVMNITMYSIPTYLALYLKDDKGAGLSVEEISLVPMFSSITSILVLSLIIFCTSTRYRRYLLISFLLSVIAYTLYYFSFMYSMFAYFASIISGIKTIEFIVSRAMLNNYIDRINPEYRSKILSVLYSIVQIVTIPAPTLLGLAYTYDPKNIWVVGIILSIIELFALIKIE